MNVSTTAAPVNEPLVCDGLGWFSGLVYLGHQIIEDGFLDTRMMGPNDAPEPEWPAIPNWRQCSDEEMFFEQCSKFIERIDGRASQIDAFVEVFYERCYSYTGWVIDQCGVNPALSALAKQTSLGPRELSKLITDAYCLIIYMVNHLHDLAQMIFDLSWILRRLGRPIDDKLCRAQNKLGYIIEALEDLQREADYMDYALDGDVHPQT